MLAWEEGRLSDDIVAEQSKVKAAELIIFQVRGQRLEAAISSGDLILTELKRVCLCSHSSRCTGSVFLPSWKGGSTGCWHKALLSHWCKCTTTVCLRSVCWRADAPLISKSCLIKTIPAMDSNQGLCVSLCLFICVNMYMWFLNKNKKAMLSFSTGAIQTMFQPDGINGDINVTLWPLQVSDTKTFYTSALNTENRGSLKHTVKDRHIIGLTINGWDRHSWLAEEIFKLYLWMQFIHISTAE